MNKVIEALKNKTSQNIQSFREAIKSFGNMLNQVDVPNEKDKKKMYDSLTAEDKRIDAELQNADKYVKTLEKSKKEFESRKDKNIKESIIENNIETKTINEMENSKIKTKNEIEKDERDI